jgi:hypothetical protein
LRHECCPSAETIWPLAPVQPRIACSTRVRWEVRQNSGSGRTTEEELACYHAGCSKTWVSRRYYYYGMHDHIASKQYPNIFWHVRFQYISCDYIIRIRSILLNFFYFD